MRRLRFVADAGGAAGCRALDVKAFVLKFAELNHETYLAAKKQTVAGKEKKSIGGQMSRAHGRRRKRAKRLRCRRRPGRLKAKPAEATACCGRGVLY